MDVCARRHRAATPRKVDGIKISLLDARQGDRAARRLPRGRAHVHRRRLQLRRADRRRRERPLDALLGIFDAIAPGASAALVGACRRRSRAFDAILAPTVPLSRHIFAAPTRFYKTGVVFMAWLNGHQSHFTMVERPAERAQRRASRRLFRLADAASLLRDPTRRRAHAALRRAARIQLSAAARCS